MIRLGIILLAAAAAALFAQAPAAPAPPSHPPAPQAPHAQVPAAPAPAAPAPAAPAPTAPAQPAPEPASAVRSVYILPMASGLDQYLAEHLTRTGAMQVVTDPKAAEAFLTDHLGEPFEQKIAEFHQPADAARNTNAIHPSFRSTSSRGTVFLVDAKSRKVIWSDYEKPGSHDSATLNHVAAQIVQKMIGKPK